MAKLNVPPTKSNGLLLKRQLEVAEEGFELLDQKRQILVFELMSRVGRARDAERRISATMAPAFAALRQAVLDMGSAELDRASLAVKMDHPLMVSEQNLMGLRIPKVSMKASAARVQFGVGGTSANADSAMRLFVAALPLLAELAELENAVIRLAVELRKTQRRCNALSEIFVPDYRETIDYIVSSLEEREREAFVILRMIKNRLAAGSAAGEEGGHV